MQSDFDDLRFTRYDDVNGTEDPLPHWIEEKNHWIRANVWIKVTEIHPERDTTLLVYYGNPVVLNESDGDATFLFFDDFFGTSLDRTKWGEPNTGFPISHSIGGGSLYFDVNNAYNSTIYCPIQGNYDIDGYMIEARQRMQMGGGTAGNSMKGTIGMSIGQREENWFRKYGRSKKENSWLRYSPSHTSNSWRQSAWNGADTGFHVLGIGKHDDTVILYEDQNEMNTVQDKGVTESEYIMKIIVSVMGYNGNGWGKLWTDWFRIRKHTTPEPILSFVPLEGRVLSEIITLPESNIWDRLSVDKTESANTFIEVTVINAETNSAINGYDNRTGKNIDLSHLNDLGITNIRLQAHFTGNETVTPYLDSMGVKWTPIETPNSIVDEGSILTSVWFWALMGTFVLVIFFLLYIRRASSKKGEKKKKTETISTEIEHVPSGGFSKESEIDIIARGLTAQRRDATPPFMEPGIQSFYDRLNTSVQPNDLKYKLTDDMKISPGLPVTGQIEDVRISPQVSVVPPGGNTTVEPDKLPAVPLEGFTSSFHSPVPETPVVVSRPLAENRSNLLKQEPQPLQRPVSQPVTSLVEELFPQTMETPLPPPDPIPSIPSNSPPPPD